MGLPPRKFYKLFKLIQAFDFLLMKGVVDAPFRKAFCIHNAFIVQGYLLHYSWLNGIVLELFYSYILLLCPIVFVRMDYSSLKFCRLNFSIDLNRERKFLRDLSLNFLSRVFIGWFSCIHKESFKQDGFILFMLRQQN